MANNINCDDASEEENTKKTSRKRKLTSISERENISSDSISSSSECSLDAEEGTGKTKSALSSSLSANGKECDHPSPHAAVAAAQQDDERAHTFRKRRLSLTLRSGEEESKADSISSHQKHKAKRRLSDVSASSISTGNSRNGGIELCSRTVHAGELIQDNHDRNDCKTPAVIEDTNQHVLYQMPHQMSVHPSSSPEQPKWKKRHMRHLDEDERKLPFPRDIVGSFSCHGVEPVYDSEYDEQESEEENDQAETTNGGGSFSCAPTSQNKAESPDYPANENPEGPRPTTVAKINQDRGGIVFPYGNCRRTALFAAYDGHGQGGELVSQFALHEIQYRLEKNPEFFSNVEKAFVDTFLSVDESLKHEPLIEPLYAGTTACVALLRDKTITVANSGDSRAVIARRNGNGWDAIDLSIDQNPDMPEEKKRIESMGGFVSPPPEPGLSARVWLDSGCTQIGLAMARSIGDHAVAEVGVIAEPVVTKHEIREDDEFLIIASDGVWEFLSSYDAVKIVSDNLDHGATKACQVLIEAAAALWHSEEGDYRDDITALVIRLNKLWSKN